MEQQNSPVFDAKVVNREHQVQVRLLQALADAVSKGDSVEEGVVQLAEYSRGHFLSEELLMRLYDYSDYQSHLLDHERMVDWLDELVKREGDREAMLHAVRELTAVFMRHIGSYDKALHDFLGELSP